MRRIGAVLGVLFGLVSVAAGQTTVTRTDRLVLLNPPAKSGETACLWRDGTTGMVSVGTCATGDITGVSFTLPSIFTAPAACTSGDCAFTFSLANQSAYSVFARGSGTGVPSFQTLADGHIPNDLTLGTVSGTPTFSGAVTFGSTLSSSLIPTTTDTYNIGSSTKLWNEGFLAQLNAVLFAEQTATLFGGWSVVGKNAGSFPARIASTDTQVDFGKAMTVGHFITIRAHDEGGSLPTAEFMQVGALVSGTTYNVTRNLSGLGAKNWPSGTSYLVNGTTGDGRIELRAYTTPQISILSQGATYNAQTELIRIGYLDGMPGMAAGKIGLYIGDLGASGMAYYDGALEVRGSVTVTGGNAIQWYSATPTLLGSISASGIALATGATIADQTAYRFTGDGLFGLYAAASSGTTRAVALENFLLDDSNTRSVNLLVGNQYHAVALDLSAAASAGKAVLDASTSIALTAPVITFDTTTLAIDSTNNRVGVGTASPAVPLDVIAPAANGTKYAAILMRVGADGTLGPTGVAIGAMPSATGGSRYGYIEAGDSGDYRPIVLAPSGGWVGIGGLPGSLFSVIGMGGTAAGASGAVPLQIDSSGNVKYVNNGATGTCANVTVVNGIVTGCS